jgi:hypothetical protein
MSLKFNPKAEVSVCRKDGSQTPILMQTNFNDSQQESILDKLHMISIVEEGRDSENWGGHYGTLFSGERFYLNLKNLADEGRDLLKTFGNRGLAFN